MSDILEFLVIIYNSNFQVRLEHVASSVRSFDQILSTEKPTTSMENGEERNEMREEKEEQRDEKPIVGDIA